jgi:hypothetical protein
MNSLLRAALLSLSLMLGGCGKDRDAGQPADTGAAATGGMAGMQGTAGMQGMEGMMGASNQQMRDHMRMMATDNADSLSSMMPMHRQMTANMISDFNRQMREMNMQADAAWTAIMDSVRQDLTRLPEVSAQELRTLMPAHRGRVMRLIEMHENMMKRMRM